MKSIEILFSRNLHTAILNRDHDLLEEILKDFSSEKDELSTSKLDQALLIAVTSDEPKMVEILLKTGANIHAFDKTYPVLHTMVDLGSVEMFDIAVKFTKTLDTIPMTGNLLQCAVNTGNFELVQKVYDAGVTEIEKISWKTGKTALHVAVERVIEQQLKNIQESDSKTVSETVEQENKTMNTHNCNNESETRTVVEQKPCARRMSETENRASTAPEENQRVMNSCKLQNESETTSRPDLRKENETTSGSSLQNIRSAAERGNKSKDVEMGFASSFHETKYIKILDFLLSKPFYSGLHDKFNDSPLHYAVRSGSRKLCEKLVEGGVSKRVLNAKMRTPWMEALEKKYRHLYDAVSDVEGVNQPIYYRKYYLHLACESGNSELVTVLLDAGANLHVSCNNDPSTGTPLDEAFWKRDKDCIKAFIYHPNFTFPPLLTDRGAKKAFRSIIRLPGFEMILDKLCTLGLCERYGHLAQEMLVSECDNLEMLKWMIERGVDPNVVIGESYALEQCSIECDDVLEYLIMNNADTSLTNLNVVDMDDEYRVPPLMVLIYRNEFSLARLAFAAGFHTGKVCETFNNSSIKDHLELFDFEPTDEIVCLVEMIKERGKYPRSLKTMCRTVIMKRLGCFETDKKIKCLGLPCHIEEFLSMKTFIEIRIREIDSWIESERQRILSVL